MGDTGDLAFLQAFNAWAKANSHIDFSDPRVRGAFEDAFFAGSYRTSEAVKVAAEVLGMTDDHCTAETRNNALIKIRDILLGCANGK